MTTVKKFVLGQTLIAACTAGTFLLSAGAGVRQTLALAALMLLVTGISLWLWRELGAMESSDTGHSNFFHTLIDTIPSPIFYKDRDGRYLGCNKAFAAYVGVPQEELAGKTVHELWARELADKYRQTDQALLDNPGTQVYEARVTYADGSLHDVVFNKATFEGADGNLGGLVGVMLDITARKHAEEQLAFRNILLSTQQECSIDGILVVDENTRIISSNRRFAELVGVPTHLLEAGEDQPVLEYVVGQVVDPEPFLQKILYLYEQQHETCRDEMVLKSGRILDRYSAPLHGPDGRYYGRLWTFRDITERKAAEEATQNAYQQMLNIVEFLPDATFVIDTDKRVIAWNRAMEKMTGLAKAEMLGRGDYEYALPFYGERRPMVIDLLEGEDRTALDPYCVLVKREGQTVCAQCVLPPLNGREARHVSSTASPLFDSNGDKVGSIESIRDLTEIKRVEDENSRLEVQVQHSQLMQQVMIRLGHDLKTPLTPLVTLLPIVAARLPDHELSRMLHICQESALLIGKLLDKTLNLTNLTSMLGSSKRENVELAAAVQGILAGSFCGVNCQSCIPAEIVVQAEPDQLKELFTNLISNAISFSEPGSAVRISAQPTETEVTVSVRDQGVGLAPGHLERVFEEFFKVDESRHDVAAPGLGLSICRRIVLNHQGKIWAESQGLGKGTTISFTLPRQAV